MELRRQGLFKMAKENFESKMNKLSKIVDKLDDENTSLDESISLYEDGLKLVKELKKQLKTYEDKIKEISTENE